MILYGQQDINQLDIDSVVDVLQSDFLTQGAKVPQFEQAICDYTKAKYAVAVNSATSALHIACLALGVSNGDSVWTSPITFVASANCALYCGASVDFVDVDINTGNLCPDALAVKLAAANQTGTLPKVVIAVHLAGHSCDMAKLALLADQYGFDIIEDASHAIGGDYGSEKIGACQYSKVCIFSFHPVKIITTAEGGVATTQDSGLAEKMAMLRSHGVTKEPTQLLRPDEGEWYYEQHHLGFNYRMTELQAALGITQLGRLDDFVATRNQIAQAYDAGLDAKHIFTVKPITSSQSAYHLQIVRLLNFQQRKQVFNKMREKGIQVHVHYYPVHLQPFYLKLGFQSGDFPQAEAFYQQILTLPLHPNLNASEVDFIIAELNQLTSI